MPHIIVQHSEEVAQMDNGVMLGSIRKNLRNTAKALSVKSRQLLTSDFSVTFQQTGSWDYMIHDIQVIILAHADRERVEKMDELAELIATAVEEAIRGASKPTEPTEVSYSVFIHLGQVGYFASSESLGDARAS